MTNPPFFGSMEEAKGNPNTVCTGADVEMVTAGGEEAFVGGIMDVCGGGRGGGRGLFVCVYACVRVCARARVRVSRLEPIRHSVIGIMVVCVCVCLCVC